MNISLWIAAALLALVVFASGASKVALPREKLLASGYAWTEDFSPSQIKLIGIVEALGAVGLIVPPAVGIQEVLSPVAAAGLALLMAAAALVHARRDEMKHMARPVVLGAVAAALAVLRFGPYGF